MGDYDYVWIIPLIGIIVILVSSLLPAAYMTDISGISSFNLWGFSFNYGSYPANVTWIQDPFIIIIRLITGGIVIVSVVLVYYLISYRNGKIGTEKLQLVYLIYPIVYTTLLIGWILLWEFSYFIFQDKNFWGMYSPGFGLITAFIGAALVLFGILLIKTIPEQKLPHQKKIPRSQELQTKTRSSEHRNFCPNCGEKVSKNDMFCRSCGQKL
ncbi:MAG: zinc ribbon domain-containing protein [Promethearchaeota archaeon]|nr:MAG: zinc ribbon domain-containing protein [Candidatus Lokiarchaeota archaeon]